MMDRNGKTPNKCPKAERCRHAEGCVNHDTFRGEYLCFSSHATNVYELERNKYKNRKGVTNDNNRKRKR